MVAQIVCNRWEEFIITLYNTTPNRIGYKVLISKFGKDFYVPAHVRAIGCRGNKTPLATRRCRWLYWRSGTIRAYNIRPVTSESLSIKCLGYEIIYVLVHIKPINSVSRYALINIPAVISIRLDCASSGTNLISCTPR